MFGRRFGASLNTGFLFSDVMLMKLFPFQECFFLPAIGGPQRARGSVIGSINDVEFGIAFLNATVTDSPNSDTVKSLYLLSNNQTVTCMSSPLECYIQHSTLLSALHDSRKSIC